MLLDHLRGGEGCQNPSNAIYDSPGPASHPWLTVEALLRSTVNRRKKIDSPYPIAVPCPPASEPCDPLPTEGKKSTVCTPMQFHVVRHPNAAIHCQQKEKNRQSVLQGNSLSSYISTRDLWPHPACHFCNVQRSVISYPISAKGGHVYGGGGG